MELSEIYDFAEDKMNQTVSATSKDLASIRTGRANPGIFNDISVSYYGVPTRMQQLASITALDARTIAINPYDKNAANDIEKAIRDSDLGVSPVRDGITVRVTMPDMTEERRRDYVKVAKDRAEEARVAIRQIRHKAKDQINKLVKDGEIGKDDGHGAEKKLDTITSNHVSKVDELLKAKEKDLLPNG